MHPQTQIQNSTTTTSMDSHQDQDQDLDHGTTSDLDLDLNHDHNTTNADNIFKTELGDTDIDDLDQDEKDGEKILNSDQPYEPLYCTDNNPPESYSVCQAKVAEWLDHHTFIERKTSVKFAVSRTQDSSTQTRSAHRSITLNQRPKLSIIGFKKKQTHQADGKSKNNDKVENIRLFRNRSEPGRDYCLLITEPVSPRVSCVGRVGSVRVQGRKAGVWRSVKAAFSNLVQTNKVMKLVA